MEKRKVRSGDRLARLTRAGVVPLNLNKGMQTKQEHVVTVDGKNLRVDGYHKGSNTVFEFLGDYWHGNPRSGFATQRAESYEKTIRRLVKLSRTYNVVYIWETDYKIKGLPLSGILGNGVIPFLA